MYKKKSLLKAMSDNEPVKTSTVTRTKTKNKDKTVTKSKLVDDYNPDGVKSRSVKKSKKNPITGATTYVNKSSFDKVFKKKEKIKKDKTFFGADRETTIKKNPTSVRNPENTKTVKKKYEGSKGTRIVEKKIDRLKGTVDKTIIKKDRKTGKITKKKVIKNRKNLKGLLKGAISKSMAKKDVYSAKPKSAKEVATETIDKMNVGAMNRGAYNAYRKKSLKKATRPMTKEEYKKLKEKQKSKMN